MAAAPAPDAAASPKKGPSLMIQAALFLVATGIAGGVGFFGGGSMKPAAEASATAENGGGGHGEKDAAHGESAPAPKSGHPAVVPLSPLTTNLAAPADAWLRLELALEFTDGADAGLAGAVETDFLGYLRTLKLHQLQGPSGLIHLKEDLEELAGTRTENKVSHVFVRAMLIE